MLPSWLSKLMDVKCSSLKSVSSNKGRDDNAAALARTRSLLRANARAKSLRPESAPTHQSDSQRFLNRIDALYVLSRVKECVSPVEAILSRDKREELGSITDAIGTDVKEITASSLSDRMDKGVDLWDREFSSMSSCASDQDGVSGRERRICSADAAALKSESAKARGEKFTMSALSEYERGSLFRSFDTGSSSSEEPDTAYSLADCNSDWDSRRQQRADGTCQEANEWISCRKGSQETTNANYPLPEAVVGESIVFVKNSYNPYEDFRESMYQMIMEKDLDESVDVEELLECYLNLNALELHDLIKEVFSAVWSDIVMSAR